MNAAFEDVNYSNPDVMTEHEVVFKDAEANFTVHATEALQSFVTVGPPLSRRDRLYLYFEYLDRMVAKVAG